MKLTTNYSLKKPEGNDVVNIDDLNYNADIIDSTMKENKTNISSLQTLSGNLSQLNTSNKTNLVSAINEVFQSANNGKELIANAIGEPLSSKQTFSAMSTDINNLLNTFKTNMIDKGVEVGNNDKFKSLIDKIASMSNNEGLDIISATKLPATGKENQICVIADNPVDNYVITSNLDDIDATRNINYIYLSSSSKEGTLVEIGENPKYNYYISKIYNKGDRYASYLYKSGAWSPLTFSKLYLVENKVEANSSYFGGLNSNAYFKFTSNGIQMGGTGSSNVHVLGTNNIAIDFSPYNTITVKGSKIGSGSIRFEVGCSSSKQSKSSSSTSGFYAQNYCTNYNSTNIGTSEFEYVININNWNSTGYLFLLAEAYTGRLVITDLYFY